MPQLQQSQFYVHVFSSGASAGAAFIPALLQKALCIWSGSLQVLPAKGHPKCKMGWLHFYFLSIKRQVDKIYFSLGSYITTFNFNLLVNTGCFHFPLFLTIRYISILNFTLSLLLLSVTELSFLVTILCDCATVASETSEKLPWRRSQFSLMHKLVFIQIYTYM